MANPATTATKITCPKCGNTDVTQFRWLEDIVSWRRVLELDGDTLKIASHYETGEGYDDGRNGRLQCHADVKVEGRRPPWDCEDCLCEFPLPDGVAPEWR